jgi:hypothetical protein
LQSINYAHQNNYRATYTISIYWGTTGWIVGPICFCSTWRRSRHPSCTVAILAVDLGQLMYIKANKGVGTPASSNSSIGSLVSVVFYRIIFLSTSLNQLYYDRFSKCLYKTCTTISANDAINKLNWGILPLQETYIMPI